MTATIPPTASPALPLALVVGAGVEVLPAIGPMLGDRRFQVDFLEQTDTPYLAIRRRRPDLVVLCFAPDDDEACEVLALLQLDPVTRLVPVVTYVAGEAYAIIPTQWPTTSGIPSVSKSSAPCRAR